MTGLCLLSFCNQSREKISPVELKPHLIEQDKSPKSDEPANASNQSNQDSSDDEITNSPYQKTPRRKKINFPDDCGTSVVIGTEGWLLRKTCGEALNAVLSDLPDDECDYESIRKAGGKFFMVIDNEKMQTYRLQEDIGSDDLEKLAQELNTTKDNIIINNKFGEGGKLLAGQEIKYQISHLEKSSSAWFDGYEIHFYSLQPNKYLVEIKCSAGVYNQYNNYLLYDESKLPAKTQVLEFPYLILNYSSNLNDYNEKDDVPDSVKKAMVKTIGGRYFNPQTKELIVFDKAHGIGDAGRYARYSLTSGQPKLEEFRARIIWSGRSYQLDDVIKSTTKTWKRYYP